MKEKPEPFVLFFDGEMLGSLRKEYGIGLVGGNLKVFLENAKRQNINVAEMRKETLTRWKKHVEAISQEPLITGKDVAKIALFGPFAGVKIQLQVAKGLEFAESGAVILIFVFMIGSFIKKPIFGVMGIPETGAGKAKVLQYLKNMVQEAALPPLSNKNWESIRKTRERMASKAPNIRGLRENLWNEILC